MTAPLACFRCNEPGHGWTECDRAPAKTPQEYERRIKDILIRWDAGKGFRTSIRKRIVEIERNAFRKARNAA